MRPKKSVRIQLSTPVLKTAGAYCQTNDLTLSRLIEAALKTYIRQTSLAGTKNDKYSN